MITLDRTDQTFVLIVLALCIASIGLLLTDHDVCEAIRDIAKEIHRIAVKARGIVKGKRR